MPQEILIVDDDRRLAEACARQLQEAGYVCRQAYEGRQALLDIRNSPPHLVLLDLLLPKQDGRAVLAELRRTASIAHIPVIVMSGVFKDKRTERECQEAGARGFLEKPFDRTALLGEIQAVLGHPPAADPQGDELRVPLSDVPVSEYVWRTMRGGFSGAVHFQRGKMHKILLLEKGMPRSIRSNVVRETLGERLLQAGRITARQHDESLRRLKHEKRLQGEVLVEMGALSPQALERCIDEQVEEKLLEMFRWTEGEAWLQPNVRAVSYATALDGWWPEDIILCGALQMRPERLAMILTLFSGQRPVVMNKPLPERAARLSSITTALRLAADAKTVGSLLGEHSAALYGLWLTGTVHFTSEAEAAAAAAASRPAAAARASAAAPTAAAAAASVHREPLRDLLALWRTQNLYELLGVPETASRDDIQAAYLQLARRYHPDRFSRESEETRSCATELFALLSAARDTLADPANRRDYMAKLRGAEPSEDRAQVQRILRAEKLCQEGEALLRKRDLAGALANFKEACELNPGEGDFHTLLGWAHFLVHRGGEQEDGKERPALEELQKGIELAPGSPKGYYYLGQLHKACGRTEMARKLFAKVLQLDPNHAEARSEKRLLAMRKDKDPKPSSGLFGFGRKKS